MMSPARRFLLLVLMFLPAATPPKVARITFEQLVRNSDIIVTGTVDRVAEVGETRGAHLRIDQTLTGDPEIKALGFVACGTWMCDITQAVSGERVRLFLRFPAGDEDASRTGPGSTTDRKALATELGTGPLYFVAHSGRGRMPLHTTETGTHVQAYGDIVEVEQGWQDTCASCVWHHDKPLPDVLAAIRSILEQPEVPDGR